MEKTNNVDIAVWQRGNATGLTKNTANI